QRRQRGFRRIAADRAVDARAGAKLQQEVGDLHGRWPQNARRTQRVGEQEARRPAAVGRRKAKNRPHPEERPLGRHAVHHFRFAIGFANSRALLIRSCATGLSARSLRVTIPFGRRATGNSTARILSAGPLARNLSAEAGKKVIKRPVSNRLTRIWGESVTTVARG